LCGEALQPSRYLRDIPKDCLEASNFYDTAAAAASTKQVRKMPSWPRSWANFSLLQLFPHRHARASPHLLG
jgi:hypothetical protein